MTKNKKTAEFSPKLQTTNNANVDPYMDLLTYEWQVVALALMEPSATAEININKRAFENNDYRIIYQAIEALYKQNNEATQSDAIECIKELNIKGNIPIYLRPDSWVNDVLPIDLIIDTYTPEINRQYLEKQIALIDANKNISAIIRSQKITDLVEDNRHFTENSLNVETVKHEDVDLISLCESTLIAQFSSELAKVAKVPRNTVFLTVLSIFSSVSCRVKQVNYEAGGSQPLGIYFCGEQPPATAKSRVLSASQLGAMDDTRQKKKRINFDVKNEKAKLARATEKDEKIEIKAKIDELYQEKNELFEFITDATPEALDATLSATTGYFSIASAEQAVINSLLGISYGDSSGNTNKDLVLKGFNGEYHNSKRKGRETYTGEVVGVVTALAQEGIIDNIISASNDTGAVERFILWKEGHLLGTRDHFEQYSMNELIENKFNNLMASMVNNGEQQEFHDLATLSLSRQSWNAIRTLRNSLEITMMDGEENATNLLRGLIGKIDIYIIKIAANLHLSTGSVSPTVHNDRVNEAINIAVSYIDHIKGLIHSSSISAISPREQTALDKIGNNVVPVKRLHDSLKQVKVFKTADGKKKLSNVTDTMQKLIDKGLVVVNESSGGVERYKKP